MPEVLNGIEMYDREPWRDLEQWLETHRNVRSSQERLTASLHFLLTFAMPVEPRFYFSSHEQFILSQIINSPGRSISLQSLSNPQYKPRPNLYEYPLFIVTNLQEKFKQLRVDILELFQDDQGRRMVRVKGLEIIPGALPKAVPLQPAERSEVPFYEFPVDHSSNTQFEEFRQVGTTFNTTHTQLYFRHPEMETVVVSLTFDQLCLFWLLLTQFYNRKTHWQELLPALRELQGNSGPVAHESAERKKLTELYGSLLYGAFYNESDLGLLEFSLIRRNKAPSQGRYADTVEYLFRFTTDDVTGRYATEIGFEEEIVENLLHLIDTHVELRLILGPEARTRMPNQEELALASMQATVRREMLGRNFS